MKKIRLILLAMLLLLWSACTLAEAPLVGGWSVADSPALSEERTAVFNKAMEGLLGVDYEPIAYLGSQVVAGFNHCFLCKATVVYPNAVPTLALVYIYEDLNGNPEITHIQNLDIGIFSLPADCEAE